MEKIESKKVKDGLDQYDYGAIFLHFFNNRYSHMNEKAVFFAPLLMSNSNRYYQVRKKLTIASIEAIFLYRSSKYKFTIIYHEGQC